MAVIDPKFNKPTADANVCNFGFTLPSFTFGIKIPPFKFPPFDIPVPTFRLAISCDLSKPIDVSVGVEAGGNRVALFDTCPDDDDSF